MSKVNDVDVRAGAVVVEGQGAGGAEGQAGGGKVVEVGPKRCVKVKKVCAYSRLLSQLLLQSWMVFTAAPAELLSKCPRGVLFCQCPRRSPFVTRRELSIGTSCPCLGV